MRGATLTGTVSSHRRNAYGEQSLRKPGAEVLQQAGKGQAVFVAKSGTGSKIGAAFAHLRQFLSGSSAASRHLMSSDAPAARPVKGTPLASAVPRPPASDPMAAAVARFKSFFPEGVPPLADVIAKRGRNPEAFQICRDVLQNNQFLVTFDFLAAFDELRSNPTIDKALEIKNTFIQDPKEDDVGLEPTGSDKLNLYQETYKAFVGAFDKALQETGHEAGAKPLLEAFERHIMPTVSKDARYFRSNVEAQLKQHGQAGVPRFAAVTPDRFA